MFMSKTMRINETIMKRRDFIKTGAVAVGAMGSLKISPALAAGLDSRKNGAASGDNRPAEYLRRVQGDRFLPKSPEPARTYQISPMPLAERIRRKIVPQRGFCSIAPGDLVSEALTSGNGAMNIELMGDPYSEQILFQHESLLMPWPRPLEAPKIADIFPQVRQLVLEGKHAEATALALQRMNASPIKQNTEPHRRIPAFLMQLEFPKSASVKNYLRSVNFETSEANVHWSDDHGDWLRQTFTSRPDNLIVQHFTAPNGQSVGVRISLQKSGE